MNADRFRVLAIDYGTKRIGLAISDEMRMLASARGVIAMGPQAIPEIVTLCVSQNVRFVLLGKPMTLSNTESDMTRKVVAFGEKLKAQLETVDIKFELRDERLTSIMANANIAMSGLRKGRREEKSLRDEEAARILLQEFLDRAGPAFR